MSKSAKKGENGSWSLIMASASLTSIIGFTLMIGGKILSERGRKSLLKNPLSWWTYSFTWHYFVFPLALFYFFKYSEEKKFNKKEILHLSILLPITYFSTNLVRSLLAGKEYFNNKPFLGNGIWWFNYLKEEKYGLLTAWVMFSIFYFWAVSYLLLRLKKWLHLSEIFPSKDKQNTKLGKEKQALFNK